MTAAYGLVNANAKWQQHSDSFLRDLGFIQLIHVPQLFYRKISNRLQALAVKVVDDIIVVAESTDLTQFVTQISSKYKVGTVVRGPGSFSFFGLEITQDTDGMIQVSGDEKLLALRPHPISRLRRKEIDERLNAVESFSFGSMNGSLGFIGHTASPFCSFTTSYLQQRRSNPVVKDLIQQCNMLRQLQDLGSTITFRRPDTIGSFPLKVVVFSDAARSNDHGQLAFVAGLVIGEVDKESVFHTIAWRSQKSKRPTKSVGAAETLAAGSAVDEGKVLVRAYQELLDITMDLVVIVDSKDLYDSLSTCRGATDKSIRADVSLIRYEFETQKISRMIWIPGNVNPADALTKPDSPLRQTLQLLMFSGRIPIDFSTSQHRDSEQFLG